MSKMIDPPVASNVTRRHAAASHLYAAASAAGPKLADDVLTQHR